MALCRKYGISHSHFLGGKRRWTELDRAKALAYEQLLREQCPNCGTLQEDWVDENGRPLEEPLMSPVVRKCYGCEEKSRLERHVPDSAKGTYVAMLPTAFLTDEDDEWYDPNRDPAELDRKRREALENARSLG